MKHSHDGGKTWHSHQLGDKEPEVANFLIAHSHFSPTERLSGYGVSERSDTRDTESTSRR